MSTKETTNVLKKYQKSGRGSQLRKRYLSFFVPRMIYRTTKTENPGLSQRVVMRMLRMKK